jgi:hypothetical protein
MAVYKFISSGVVIGKVFRDFDVRDDNWTLKAQEWINEIVNTLGHHQYTTRSVVEQTVSSFKTAIPDYMIKPDEIWKHPDDTDTEGDKVWVPHDKDCFQHNIIDSLEDPPYAFLIQPNCLQFTFETGTVTIVYFKKCVDDDGYPFIPESEYFLEACTWKIVANLLQTGKWKSPVPDINWTVARREYRHYFQMARDRIKMPTPQEMDEFVKNWTGISTLETDYTLYSQRRDPNRTRGIQGDTSPYGSYGTSEAIPLLNTAEFIPSLNTEENDDSSDS